MEKTAQLNDEDRIQRLRDEEKHRERIGKVAREIEAILLREDMSWGEWEEVIDIFMSRTHSTLSNIKINEIKKKYDSRN